MTRVWRSAALLAAGLLAACDSQEEAGALVGDLVADFSDVGAVAFSVTADDPFAIASLTVACQGCQLYTVGVNDREIRGVVVGIITPGPLLRLMVSDVGVRDAYRGTVTGVAGVDLGLLQVSDYEIRFRR